MDSTTGGMSSERQRQLAAEIARKKVLAVYSSAADKINRRNPENNNPYNVSSHPQSPLQTYSEPQTNSWNTATSYTSTTPQIQHSFNNIEYQNPYYNLSSANNQVYTSAQNYNLGYNQGYMQSSNYYQAPSREAIYSTPSTTENTFSTDQSLADTPPYQSLAYHSHNDYTNTNDYSNSINFNPEKATEQEDIISNNAPESRRAQRYDRKYGDAIDEEIRELENMEDSVEDNSWSNDIIPDNALVSNNLKEDSVPMSTASNPTTLKDTTVDADFTASQWEQYHSAWQNYYQKYYNDYYSRAAQTYLATEKMKDERIATGKKRKARRARHLAPLFIVVAVVLVFLFLQYNRLIFAPIMAYIAPDSGNTSSSLEAVNPNINQPVSPEPRLIIPKLNIDVPVAFDVHFNDVMEAMNYGVAHYAIPGANATPGQIGNFVITGHSAGDIYSSNPYKFIFSGLERLQEGDLIYVNYNSIRYTYQMTKREVVDPSNVSALVYETNKPMITLITCTPLGTSKYRLLITGEQINPSYDGAEDVAPENESEITEDITEDQGVSMPANEPSFFENIWNWLTGQS